MADEGGARLPDDETAGLAATLLAAAAGVEADEDETESLANPFLVRPPRRRPWRNPILEEAGDAEAATTDEDA